MHSTLITAIAAALAVQTNAQQVASDPGVAGSALEVAHLYSDQFPTGFAMSSTGRMFTSYPAALYGPNINNYTVGELTSMTTEKPYPNLSINTPPPGRVNSSTTLPTTVNSADKVIAVQGMVVDALDRL